MKNDPFLWVYCGKDLGEHFRAKHNQQSNPWIFSVEYWWTLLSVSIDIIVFILYVHGITGHIYDHESEFYIHTHIYKYTHIYVCNRKWVWVPALIFAYWAELIEAGSLRKSIRRQADLLVLPFLCGNSVLRNLSTGASQVLIFSSLSVFNCCKQFLHPAEC